MMKKANVEIEKKYLIKEMPNLSLLPKREITQGYLCSEPTIRIRKDNDEYYMTYKGKGMMVKTEYNLPLNEKAFLELLPKCNGRIIKKARYECMLPEQCDGAYGQALKAEIDIFYNITSNDIDSIDITSNGHDLNDISSNEHDSHNMKGSNSPLCFLEVEFEDANQAASFIKPDWFGDDVTDNPDYYNSSMALNRG